MFSSGIIFFFKPLMIHLEFILVYGVKGGSHFIFFNKAIHLAHTS